MNYEELYQYCEELVGNALEDRTSVAQYILLLGMAFHMLQLLVGIHIKDKRLHTLLPIVIRHLSGTFKKETAKITAYRLERAYLRVSNRTINFQTLTCSAIMVFDLQNFGLSLLLLLKSKFFSG